MTAKTKPRKYDPESPMKMRAGLKLKNKKPNTDPRRTAIQTATISEPDMNATTRLVIAAKNTKVAVPSSRPRTPR